MPTSYECNWASTEPDSCFTFQAGNAARTSCRYFGHLESSQGGLYLHSSRAGPIIGAAWLANRRTSYVKSFEVGHLRGRFYRVRRISHYRLRIQFATGGQCALGCRAGGLRIWDIKRIRMFLFAGTLFAFAVSRRSQSLGFRKTKTGMHRLSQGAASYSVHHA